VGRTEHCYAKFVDQTNLRSPGERPDQASAGCSQGPETARQRLNDVLNMLPAYVVLLSPGYHVPFANRFFEERFGKSESRVGYEYLCHRTAPCEVCETFKVLEIGQPRRYPGDFQEEPPGIRFPLIFAVAPASTAGG
jgi:hypothetical protein